MTNKQLRNAAINFIAKCGKCSLDDDNDQKIVTKFKNVCQKTGQYNVPSELFQKRTSRTNRVLMSWKDVKNNNLTIDMLKSFKNGITIEFLNNDFFNDDNYTDELFLALIEKLGSNETISSIISIRTEDGSSSSSKQRECFDKLTNNLQVNYNGTVVTITKDNFKNYAIKKDLKGNVGNEKWSGFLYVSIRGGQQDTIETHIRNYTVFNPACEYASEKVCLDIDFVLLYFAMVSIDKEKLSTDEIALYDSLFSSINKYLARSYYSNSEYTGNLLDYCTSSICVSLIQGQLTDPIQLKRIIPSDFASYTRTNNDIDLTHNVAVNKGIFLWDDRNECVLSAARPTNVFWSYHLSNMMQQDFTLNEYFEREKLISEERSRLLN